MKTLFIGHDKDEWEYLERLFKAHFSKIDLVCCDTQETAIDYVTNQGGFGIIIIECANKKVNPTRVANEIIEMMGERPVIFIGAEAMINDRVDDELILNYACNEILKKPFEVDDFVTLIKKALAWAQQEEFEQSIEEIDKEDLLPMKIRSFYIYDELPYDVYLELNRNKFIKIISKNKKYTHTTLNSYAKKNIKYLYLGKDDYLKFLDSSIDTLIHILENASQKKAIDHEHLFDAEIKSVVIIHQFVRSIGINDRVIELTLTLINAIHHHYDNTAKNLNEILSMFPLQQKDFAEHSILTYFVCEAMSDKINWKSEMTRKKLGLASILQNATLDDEKFVTYTSLEDPRVNDLSEKELRDYTEHPTKAADLSRYFQGFPDTDFIIQQHHESPHGNGFPNGINANKLTKISCLFILASNFASKLAGSGISSDAIRNIINEFRAVYDISNFKDSLEAFEKSLLTKK